MKSGLSESVGGFLADLESSRVKKTFLFVDVFNSTEYKLIRPDNAWVPAIAEFYRIVINNVEGNGGSVVKFLGDGAMAVFDRAEDALRSAIALQEELDQKRRSNSTELRCKIGIATDFAYAYKTADDKFDYLGAVVDLAARLCSHANGNAILLSSKVFLAADLEGITSAAGRALQRTTEEYFGDAKKDALKGIKDPVAYYALFWQATPEGYVTTQAAPQAAPQVDAAQRGQATAQAHLGVPKAQRQRGIVSRFFPEKGFGFIGCQKADGAPDSLFFHKSGVVGGCPVMEGEGVSFTSAVDDHGRAQATAVVVIGSTIVGRVARFDPDHFGFISARDNEGGKVDFFVLPRDVQGVIAVDDAVAFQVGETPRGLIARDVRRTERSEDHVPGAEHLELGSVEHGLVDYLDTSKGFGFISCRGNRIFAHFAEIMDEERTLNKGDLVEFIVSPGKDSGYKAGRIHVVQRAVPHDVAVALA